MMPPARRPYSDLGWVWRRLTIDGSEHLVPSVVLPRSATACHRPLPSVTYEPLFGAQRCAACLRANGGLP